MPPTPAAICGTTVEATLVSGVTVPPFVVMKVGFAMVPRLVVVVGITLVVPVVGTVGPMAGGIVSGVVIPVIGCEIARSVKVDGICVIVLATGDVTNVFAKVNVFGVTTIGVTIAGATAVTAEG